MNNLIHDPQDFPTHKLLIPKEDYKWKKVLLTTKEAAQASDNINNPTDKFIVLKRSKEFYPKYGCKLEKLDAEELQSMRSNFTRKARQQSDSHNAVKKEQWAEIRKRKSMTWAGEHPKEFAEIVEQNMHLNSEMMRSSNYATAIAEAQARVYICNHILKIPEEPPTD